MLWVDKVGAVNDTKQLFDRCYYMRLCDWPPMEQRTKLRTQTTILVPTKADVRLLLLLLPRSLGWVHLHWVGRRRIHSLLNEGTQGYTHMGG